MSRVRYSGRDYAVRPAQGSRDGHSYGRHELGGAGDFAALRWGLIAGLAVVTALAWGWL